MIRLNRLVGYLLEGIIYSLKVHSLFISSSLALNFNISDLDIDLDFPYFLYR